MPIPPYVAHLRTMIGHELLWLPGCTAVVLRQVGDRTEVLLLRRSDTGEWTPVTGIVDPGEEPHVAAVREVLEETCVVAEVERLVWVSAGEVIEHVNGDRGQYLDHTYRCGWVSGEPRPGDDEATETAWFALSELPPMPQRHVERIACAVEDPREVRMGR
ncbi:MAG: NUDIX domain-containing protein [Intrasporangium sp.]|uniref:NUDIX hydrolase n=1 Tax=Intrasporangium sp. TaxID=1925024 RepID=UPI00264932AB|nr:NUDIX domain-containing protein [Intrasporangium sp.]MDN5797822.1 NUDIX domain-containing protein [Intrasporangium sp.]